MKPHRAISRALLLVLLLSPFCLRAFGDRISAPSCRILSRVSKQVPHQRADNSSHHVVAAIGHRSPAQRIRLRGKRINFGTTYVAASITGMALKESTPRSALPIQERSGPNPPRAPPLLSL